VSKDTFGGADEVVAALGMGGKSDNNGGGVGQSDLLRHGGPTDDAGTLEVEEEKDAAEEALNAAALAEILAGPGRWEAGAFPGTLGIPGDDGGGAEGGVDPGDESEAPVGGIEADDAGATIVERDDGGEQRLGERGIVSVRGSDAEEGGEARAPAEHGVDAEAAEQGRRVMRGRVPVGGIGIVRAPGENGGAVDDEVAQAHDALGDRGPDGTNKEHLVGRGTQGPLALALLGRTRHAGTTTLVRRQPAGNRERRPSHEPVVDVPVRQAPEHAQEPDHEERFRGIDHWMSPSRAGEHRRSFLGKTDRASAESK